MFCTEVHVSKLFMRRRYLESLPTKATRLSGWVLATVLEVVLVRHEQVLVLLRGTRVKIERFHCVWWCVIDLEEFLGEAAIFVCLTSKEVRVFWYIQLNRRALRRLRQMTKIVRELIYFVLRMLIRAFLFVALLKINFFPLLTTWENPDFWWSKAKLGNRR